MTRSALIVMAALLAAPMGAAAQPTSSDQLLYGAGMAICVAPGLVFDALIIKNLVEDGVVRKGFSINALAFGSVALLIGGAAGYALLTDTRVPSGFGSGFLGIAALGAGTAVLGMWGLFHSRQPPPEPSHLEDFKPPTEDRYLPPPADDVPPPPPAYLPTPQAILMPQIGITPRGGLMVGFSGTL